MFPGYTVSSVIVGDWRRLYVAGAPRFKHKGKVILFELSNDGDVNIVQALNGEQVTLSARASHFHFVHVLERKTAGIPCQGLTRRLPLLAVTCNYMFLLADWILLWQWGVWAGHRPGWHHWCPSGCCSNVPRLRKQGGWPGLHLHPQWGKTVTLISLLYRDDSTHHRKKTHNLYQVIVSDFITSLLSAPPGGGVCF